MYLSEIFDQLSQGELSQTNLGTIDETKWGRLVMHVNLGLADLFKRFFLREGRFEMTFVADQTIYPIDFKYAASNTRSKIVEAYRFIQDSTSAPFPADVLKVEKVLTDAGVELTINDSAATYPILVADTMPITLRVHEDIVGQASDLPDDLKTESFTVVYRARHPKIDAAKPGFDPSRYEVRLPDSHLQALCYYVASRALGPVGMGQTEGLSSAGYWQRYEAECAQLEAAGLEIVRSDGYDRLRDRGFV